MYADEYALFWIAVTGYEIPRTCLPYTDVGMMRLAIHQRQKHACRYQRFDFRRGKQRMRAHDQVEFRDPTIKRCEVAPFDRVTVDHRRKTI